MQTLQDVLRTISEPDASDVAELHMRVKIDGAVARFPGALVIGAHQVVSLDGKLRETPRTLDAARDLLLELRGKTHQLHSAIALAEEGEITWSSVDTAHITMRPLSAQFVGRYLAAAGTQAMGSPGAYEIDAAGLQLLDRIDGGFPAVLGAPLFPLLTRLREIGFLVS
jgi:septum formation protein